MNWVSKVVLNGFALLIADKLITGIRIEGITAAFIGALVLGIINTIIRPILIFLTLPITILSLGLFIFIINAITFALTASFVDGFTVFTFTGALLGAIITSVISWLLNTLAKDE